MEWTVSKKQCTDLRPPARCVYIHPPSPPKGKEEKKGRSSALPTPFLPLRPLLQPPAAPSHSSYEPRAGRSEYNFLYCVNVRTIRLNKKKNVYITKRQRLDHCVSHHPSRPDVVSVTARPAGDVVRFMNDSVEISGEFSDLSESRLNGTDDRARKLNHRDLKLR